MFDKSLWTKELLAWYLYDLANSFITITMTVYFSQWLVVDKKVSDFWFSLAFVVPTFILIFLSTYIGSLGDRKGSHSKIFIATTLATFLSVVALLIVGRVLSGLIGVILVLLFFAFYQFFVQLALVPYYAFIKHISNEKIYGRVSGIGFTFSQIGSILGLLLTLPIVNGSIIFFGKDRLAPLVPSLILFFIFFLPSYFVFRKKLIGSISLQKENKSFWKTFISNLKDSKKYPGVFPLLISFYLFSDAIATLTLYSAIYLQNVFNISDSVKVGIFLFVLVGFALGSFFGGVLSDKYSHKLTLIIALFFNALSIFVSAFNTRPEALTIIFFIFGSSMGLVYTASRSYLAFLVP
ncbi:MFS transporter, partial [Candidatus Woesearchaeota archaeon]|nr:MFS transporter [Candidatus Woesearchaeota archaeon]